MIALLIPACHCPRIHIARHLLWSRAYICIDIKNELLRLVIDDLIQEILGGSSAFFSADRDPLKLSNFLAISGQIQI